MHCLIKLVETPFCIQRDCVRSIQERRFKNYLKIIGMKEILIHFITHCELSFFVYQTLLVRFLARFISFKILHFLLIYSDILQVIFNGYFNLNLLTQQTHSEFI